MTEQEVATKIQALLPAGFTVEAVERFDAGHEWGVVITNGERRWAARAPIDHPEFAIDRLSRAWN